MEADAPNPDGLLRGVCAIDDGLGKRPCAGHMGRAKTEDKLAVITQSYMHAIIAGLLAGVKSTQLVFR